MAMAAAMLLAGVVTPAPAPPDWAPQLLPAALAALVKMGAYLGTLRTYQAVSVSTTDTL
jgi:hypothetical protein